MCLSVPHKNEAIKLPSSLAMNTTPVTKPCRAYTEYNIFFQLEREYILQVELGFQPDYEYEDIFDPANTNNYQGPPLPSKYNGLILLSDWHLPGKEKRRKRRHRKTHGKIGFQELSLKIADNWRNVDAETRTYCAELCDVGLIQYKNQMRAWKAANPEEDECTPSITEEKSSNPRGSVCFSEEWGPTPLFEHGPNPRNESRYVPTDRCSLAEVDAAFENDWNLSMSDLSASTTSLRTSVASSAESMVDIDDDEIINMWKSTPEDDGEDELDMMIAQAGGTVVSDTSIGYPMPSPIASRRHLNQFSFQDVLQSQVTASTRFSFQEPNQGRFSQEPNKADPYSGVDAALADLKNMRKVLLNQQRQLQFSMIAARRLSNAQDGKKRNGFAACSA